MTRPIRDILAERALIHFVGRHPELDRLHQIFDAGGPLVIYIHGLAGVGKSTLLQVYAAQAAARSITVVRLDARLFEPTAGGLTQELSAAPEKLHELAPRVVLLIDAYEHLRVLDTWIRQSFIPSLHDTVRVVVASRHPPNPPWLIEPEWQGHFAAIALGPLNQAESVELLRRRGYPEADSAALIRIANGHPLSLSLGSVRPVTEAFEGTGVLQRLAQLYLADAVSRANPEIIGGLWIFGGKSIWRDHTQMICVKSSYPRMRRGISGWRS